MKASAFLVVAGAAIVAAQDLGSLPQCGQTCISNMVGIATSQFGCAQNDVRCYCCNANFGYGVRDCAQQSCSGSDAGSVIAFGTQFCQAAIANGCGNSNGGSSSGSGSGSGSSSTSGGNNNSSGSSTGSGGSSTTSGSSNTASDNSSAETTVIETATASDSSSASSTDSASNSDSSDSSNGSETSSGTGSDNGDNGDNASNTGDNGDAEVTVTTDVDGSAAMMTAAPVLGAGALALLLLV